MHCATLCMVLVYVHCQDRPHPCGGTFTIIICCFLYCLPTMYLSTLLLALLLLLLLSFYDPVSLVTNMPDHAHLFVICSTRCFCYAMAALGSPCRTACSASTAAISKLLPRLASTTDVAMALSWPRAIAKPGVNTRFPASCMVMDVSASPLLCSTSPPCSSTGRKLACAGMTLNRVVL